MKTVFLFSGQGSQYPGMGKELAELYPDAAAEIFGTAEKVLGFDLKEKMLNGTAEELAVTTVSQPAILAASLLALHAAKDKGLTYTAVAGHSLGEYAAMAASGMLTVEEAFTAIKYRSEAMDKAAKANPGGMAAVINLDSGKIAEICEKISAEGEYITPVNPLSTRLPLCLWKRAQDALFLFPLRRRSTPSSCRARQKNSKQPQRIFPSRAPTLTFSQT